MSRVRGPEPALRRLSAFISSTIIDRVPRRERASAHSVDRRLASIASRRSRSRSMRRRAFILQFAGVMKLVDEFPLRLDKREFELVAEFGEPFVMVITVLAMLDVLRAGRGDGRVSVRRRSRELARSAASRVEPFDRRLDCAPADLELLVPFGLSLAASCVSETERASHRGQRQAFADQGHENDAEGQKQDQIAVGKRASIGYVKGIASAAAKETMPRTPVNATRKRPLPRRRRVIAPDRGNEPSAADRPRDRSRRSGSR